MRGAVAAAADGAFADAEVVGHVVAGRIAVAAAGLAVEQHQEVLERCDAVSTPTNPHHEPATGPGVDIRVVGRVAASDDHGDGGALLLAAELLERVC